MYSIKQAVFEKSSIDHKNCPNTSFPEYAFIGRSNVGKSSLINLLTNRKNLAKTSSTPGKTQLINHFKIDDNWYIVDLPGYGWAKVSKKNKQQWKQMIENYLLYRENLMTIFLLIDSRHAPMDSDITFIRWLGTKQIPFSLVFTKIDKQSKSKTSININNYLDYLRTFWQDLPPVFSSSMVTGEGKDILEYIDKLNSTLESKSIDG